VSGRVERPPPARSCVVCRRRLGKGELLRLRLGDEGRVVLDPTGKGPGRGAYLCRRPACWQAPELAGRLAHALRCPRPAVDPEEMAALAAGLKLADEVG
jgi:predicted RNA-binding protein YlxR (DUF448 family)